MLRLVLEHRVAVFVGWILCFLFQIFVMAQAPIHALISPAAGPLVPPLVPSVRLTKRYVEQLKAKPAKRWYAACRRKAHRGLGEEHLCVVLHAWMTFSCSTGKRKAIQKVSLSCFALMLEDYYAARFNKKLVPLRIIAEQFDSDLQGLRCAALR